MSEFRPTGELARFRPSCRPVRRPMQMYAEGMSDDLRHFRNLPSVEDLFGDEAGPCASAALVRELVHHLVQPLRKQPAARLVALEVLQGCRDAAAESIHQPAD